MYFAVQLLCYLSLTSIWYSLILKRKSVLWSFLCIHLFFSQDWWASLWPLFWIFYQVHYLFLFHYSFYPDALSCTFIWNIFLSFLILFDFVFFPFFCGLVKTAIFPSFEGVVTGRLGVYFSLLPMQCLRCGNLSRTVSPLCFSSLESRIPSPPGYQNQTFKGHTCVDCIYVLVWVGQSHGEYWARAQLPAVPSYFDYIFASSWLLAY